ncbi:MAG TPA: peptide deformylase [Anaerolineales bacterium]|nr:peptide deformylase [Anaerolineales bacterium]
MAIREIITLPHETLRRKARKVTSFGAELQSLIDDMVDTMRVAPGVGLAAPQMNVPLRVIVVEFNDSEDEEAPPKLYIYVNPKITLSSADEEVGTEGCLSIPGIVGDVSRPITITVKGLNRHGQPMKLKASGWLARIFLHEVDHLNGVLFVDRAEKVWPIEGETTQIGLAD